MDLWVVKNLNNAISKPVNKTGLFALFEYISY